MFYIYVIQNTINEKIYVGKAAKPLQRFAEHKRIADGIKPREHSLIHSAISKHGVANFTFQIIEEWEDEAEAYEAEKFWIEFLRTDVSRFGRESGYNVNEGGRGAGSGPANPMYGKTHTDEVKAQMSLERSGERNAMFGRKHSAKTKSIMASKRSQYTGERNPRAKLTDRAAEEIRKEFETGNTTRRALATKYDISIKIIQRITNNEIYKRKRII